MTTDAPGDVYRYLIDAAVPAAEIEATLVLAIFGIEALHGAAQTRLDVQHAFDARRRVLVLDAGTPAGRDLNRLFLGYFSREFGPDSFRVERVHRLQEAEHNAKENTQPATVTA